MALPSEIPIPGVRGLEHTADVGLEVEGADLQELFFRGAQGAMWMVLEREPDSRSGTGSEGPSAPESGPAAGSFGEPEESRTLNLTEEDLPDLFRSWLRALLFWEETEGFVVTGTTLAVLPVPLCSAPDGQAFGLHARVEGVVDRGPRVREIKGVTLHDLKLERRGKGWYGRVIFDV